VKDGGLCGKLLRSFSIVLWVALIFLPMVFLFAGALSRPAEPELTTRVLSSAVGSFGLAATIATAAVVLGWVPGRLLGTSTRARGVLLLLLLMPLVLPRYVLYYAWTLLLSPTTRLGEFLSARPEVARFVGTATSSLVLVLWYWPVAALLLAQGWRSLDRRILDSASLEAGPLTVLRSITLPVLCRPLLLAFAVCLVLAASEFATFHLAGVRTLGAELAVLYELTGSEADVARAAWPVVIAAVAVAFALGGRGRRWSCADPVVDAVRSRPGRWRWGVLVALLGVSVVVPVALLAASLTELEPFRQFMSLHLDELAWSLLVSAVAAVCACLIAFGASHLATPSPAGRRVFASMRVAAAFVMRVSIFAVMLVPASAVAASLLKMLAACNVPAAARQAWPIVSAGQTARFSGLALVLLLLCRYGDRRHFSEMASVDGASGLQAWWYVHLPRTWPLAVGTFILVVIFGLTELAATMVLLPPGLPNFAQRLLNQMHYARDQHVIASSLVLICVFLALGAAIVLMLRTVRLRGRMIGPVLCLLLLVAAGCDGPADGRERPKVLAVIGHGGRGPGQFVYPRAIDIAPGEVLLIVDKTGRIQRLDMRGRFVDAIQMPRIEAGKPTGLGVHPSGQIYVADTHYHRVLVFSPRGQIVREFGRFGREEGRFIYPTDVAFAEDGRIFVSEYGGNDRVSVFSEQGQFLYSFGSPGSGRGQLSRPSALCFDRGRDCLYVADACNHRIAVYRADGELVGYIGSLGRGPGRLRYPYDVALTDDGRLVVCEFGNNRIQLFDPGGRSLAVYGKAGSGPGQLAYPWGVAVDRRRRAFIVDAGNDRIQVWQL